MSEVEQEQTHEEDGTEQIEGVPAEPAPDELTPDEEEAAEQEEQQGALPDEGEQEQPQGLSEKQMEQAFGKLERETTRHANRVQEIMGEDVAMLLPCPLCEPLIPGFVMPTPDTPQRFPTVREFMGDAIPEDWQQDPNTRTCVTCNGLGMVATGSKVEGQAQLVCTDCGGKGWQGQRAPTVAPIIPAPLPEGNGGQTGPLAPAPVDPPDVAALKAKGYVIIAPAGT
jgi:hypothetical protein